MQSFIKIGKFEEEFENHVEIILLKTRCENLEVKLGKLDRV